MDPDHIKATVEHLHAFVEAGKVNVDAVSLSFPTGQMRRRPCVRCFAIAPKTDYIWIHTE